MKKEEKSEILKFEIDQLRKDRMIYALESIALTFIMELGYVLMMVLLGGNFSVLFALIALIIPLGYYLYMIIVNILRSRKILKMEKELYRK